MVCGDAIPIDYTSIMARSGIVEGIKQLFGIPRAPPDTLSEEKVQEIKGILNPSKEKRASF